MSTIQDYQAAEQLLRRPARPGEWVIGDKVRPQWIDGGARFWSAMSDGAGKRFVLVDPAAGIREPAFDHARLAAALASTSGQEIRPEALGTANAFPESLTPAQVHEGEQHHKPTERETACRESSGTADVIAATPATTDTAIVST
jgi:hypothetical protein